MQLLQVAFSEKPKLLTQKPCKIQSPQVLSTPSKFNPLKEKKLTYLISKVKKYKELQQLQEKYANQLVVIGTPCNQFGGQEPGQAAEIKTFCEKNYGVTFLMTEKLNVKGGQQHELYRWLTQKSVNGVLDSEVGWNFSKYLLNENGQLLGFFPSTTGPLSTSITSLIEK